MRRRNLVFFSFLFFFLSFPVITYSQDLENLGDQKLVSLDGSITISGTKYSVAGAPRRRPPTSWTIVGTPTLSLFGISLPFNFIFSDQESNFRQPFDQFGVSPSYQWVTLHLGYNSLSYSKYTLAGITLFGAGVELNPEPLRLSVMYGRFQRPVELDTSAAGPAFCLVQPPIARRGLAVNTG